MYVGDLSILRNEYINNNIINFYAKYLICASENSNDYLLILNFTMILFKRDSYISII